MATQTVCNFNKYGFCRYQEGCRKFHENKICETLNCVVKECLHRHPKCCKFLRDYGYCKFGEYCKFSHKAFGMKSDVEKEELKKLKEKLENLEKEINSKDELIKDLEIEIKLHESKFEKINKKLNSLKQRESDLTDLQVKTNYLEEATKVNSKDTTEKIERIENTLKQIQDSLKKVIDRDHIPTIVNEEVSTNSNLENFENEQAKHIESLKCDYCDFIGKTEGGLKTHMRYKHTRIMNQLSWKHCTFCNYNCKTESEMEMHVSQYGATHSQTNIKNNSSILSSEISKLSDNGYILYACESAQARMQHFEQQKHFGYN